MTTPSLAGIKPVSLGPTWERRTKKKWLLPKKTLGWQILGWTAEYLRQPDGPDAGNPWRYTDEQARFILWWYAVDDHGRFVYRYGMLRRVKGWGLARILSARHSARTSLSGPAASQVGMRTVTLSQPRILPPGC